MAFKLKASSPLTIKIDEKLKFKEFDPTAASKKVKYSNNPFLKPGVNTYEKDAAQLKSEPYVPGKGVLAGGSYASIRANSRMKSYIKRGGSVKPDKLKAGEGVLRTPKPNKLKAGEGVLTTPKNRIKDGLSDAKKIIKKDPKVEVVTKKDPKVEVVTKNKRSRKEAYAKRDMKIYGNLSQSQFNTESNRQIASKKAGKGYDAPKKSMGKVRKKVEAVKPMKAAGVDVKRQTPKLAGDVRTKAQKIRAKGVAILADKKLSTRQKQKQARSTRKQYDAEMAKNKKKKPVVKVKKKPVVKAKKKVVEVVAK